MRRLLAAILLALIPELIDSAPVLSMRAVLPLASVRMMNARSGWGVANRIVFRSTDGGQNWSDVMPCGILARHQLATFFLSGDDAWVAVAPATEPKIVSSRASAITIFRTTNGGRTWRSTRISVSGGIEPFNRLTFANRSDGWLWLNEGVAAGSAYYILLRTVDGGRHWTKTACSQPYHRSAGAFPGCDCTRSITFRDGATGWASGVRLVPVFSSLWVTHDGGYHWRPQKLPVPSGYSVWQSYAPVFFGRRDGILPVQLARGPAIDVFDTYMTHNGGLTWSGTTPLALGSLAQRAPLPVFSFVDSARGWVTNGRDLYRTNDAGHHWARLHPQGPFAAAGQLDFVRSSVGFALAQLINGGSPPYLLDTVDGGRAWRRVRTYSLSRPLHNCR